jgi:hypothetical protein
MSERRLGNLRAVGLVALAIVAVLGATLRLLGIGFGLPYHHHWDEVWITESVLGMARRHDGVPASYQYGAPLMRIDEAAFLVVRWLRDASGDPSVAEAQSTLYRVSRWVTAVLSSTGVVAVFVAARRPRAEAWASTVRAVAAALLYAVSSELVLHARYAVTDACLASFTAWTLGFAALYLDGGRLAWGVAAVLAAGVTCAFKMPGIVTTLIPLFATLALYSRAPRAGRERRVYRALLLATVPVVLATYVALNPHVVDRSHDAFHDLWMRYRQTKEGGFSSVYLRRPGLPHLASALVGIATQFPSRVAAVSLAVTAVSLWGIARDVRQRDLPTATAAAYAACLVLSVALPNRTFLYRNYLVVMPVLCIGFGGGRRGARRGGARAAGRAAVPAAGGSRGDRRRRSRGPRRPPPARRPRRATAAGRPARPGARLDRRAGDRRGSCGRRADMVRLRQARARRLSGPRRHPRVAAPARRGERPRSLPRPFERAALRGRRVVPGRGQSAADGPLGEGVVVSRVPRLRASRGVRREPVRGQRRRVPDLAGEGGGDRAEAAVR